MSRKDDRQRCLELRHNPSLAFASTDSLIEAIRLVYETKGGHKLRAVLSNVSRWLSPHAALTYWHLYSQAEKMTAERAKRLVRVRNDPKTVIIDIEREWCTTQERAVIYFGALLDGLCTAPLTVQGIGLTGFAASWMLLNHNPSHFADAIPIPIGDMSDTLPLEKLVLLYEAAAAGNGGAIDILHTWWMIMAQFGKTPALRDNPVNPMRHMPWQPPDCCTDAMKMVVERIKKELQNSGLLDMSPLVEEKKERIIEAIGSLWENIGKHARRGIRPEGDIFHVQRPFDRLESGYRCLLTTGLTFPEVHVGTAIPYGGKCLWLSEKLFPDRPISSDSTTNLLSVLASMLAYQQLVCQEPTELDDTLPRPADSVEQIVGLPYNVRHHDRRLPEGHRSHQQEEYEAAFGRPPDDGVTFVRTHERHRRPSFRRLRKLDQNLPKPVVTINITKVLKDL